MLPADYHPWTIVQNIDVHVEGVDEFDYVRVPFVYAKDSEAVLTTAKVACFLVTRVLMKKEAQAGRQSQVQELRGRKYEPPLVRFSCNECQDSWDAWVGDDGSLEDEWAVVCTNGDCPHRGFPASLINEES